MKKILDHLSFYFLRALNLSLFSILFLSISFFLSFLHHFLSTLILNSNKNFILIRYPLTLAIKNSAETTIKEITNFLFADSKDKENKNISISNLVLRPIVFTFYNLYFSFKLLKNSFKNYFKREVVLNEKKSLLSLIDNSDRTYFKVFPKVHPLEIIFILIVNYVLEITKFIKSLFLFNIVSYLMSNCFNTRILREKFCEKLMVFGKIMIRGSEIENGVSKDNTHIYNLYLSTIFLVSFTIVISILYLILKSTNINNFLGSSKKNYLFIQKNKSGILKRMKFNIFDKQQIKYISSSFKKRYNMIFLADKIKVSNSYRVFASLLSMILHYGIDTNFVSKFYFCSFPYQPFLLDTLVINPILKLIFLFIFQTLFFSWFQDYIEELFSVINISYVYKNSQVLLLP